MNLAARLCDEAGPDQVLVSQRVYAVVEELVDAEPLPDFTLKGFVKPVPAWSVLGLRAPPSD